MRFDYVVLWLVFWQYSSCWMVYVATRLNKHKKNKVSIWITLFGDEFQQRLRSSPTRIWSKSVWGRIPTKTEIIAYENLVELISYMESMLLGDPFNFLADYTPNSWTYITISWYAERLRTFHTDNWTSFLGNRRSKIRFFTTNILTKSIYPLLPYVYFISDVSTETSQNRLLITK